MSAERCTAIKANDEPCGAYAVPGSDPPLCRQHGMTPEERSEHARTMGEASGASRRARAKPRGRAGLPPLAKEDVVSVIAPALTGTLETGEADWSARLAAIGVLVVSFPQHYRLTPEKVRELIERALPVSVLEEREMIERLSAQAVYKSLRQEWLRVPSWHPIRGLFHESFPRAYIAPWEDYDEVCRNEMPADIPPDRAPVTRLHDGSNLLRREGQLPIVL